MTGRKVWLWATLFLVLSVPIWGQGWGQNTIQWYDEQLLHDVARLDQYYKDVAQSGHTGIKGPDGSIGYYMFRFRTDGIAAIYEATGREYYLQRLIEYCKLMMAAGKDNNGDGYVDYFHWAYDYTGGKKDQWDYEPGYNYGAHCYWNAMGTLARCARVGRLGPHYDKYKADIDEIVDFVKKQVIEKWEKGDQGITLDQWIGQTRFGMNAFHSHAGSFMVDAYLATGDEYIKDLAIRLTEKVKGAWVLYSNGSYAWAAVGGVRVPKDHKESTFYYEGKRYAVQDTNHSCRIVRFAVIAHRAGLVVTDEDMEHLANTFNKNLWRGNDEKFAYYVNGADHPEGKTSGAKEQWVRLGAFDDTLQDHLLNWTVGLPEEFADNRITNYGVLALNLKLRAEGYRLRPYQESPR